MKRKSGSLNPMGVIGAITGAHLIQYPSGTWGFVGRVPASLSYENMDGTPISNEDARNIASHGAGLFRKRIRSISFETPRDAIIAAREIGIEPVNASEYE